MKTKVKARRYVLFQRLANWVIDPRFEKDRSYTNGGVIGEVNAFSQKQALEMAVEQYPNFRGTIHALPYGEPVDEDKWYHCLEEDE